MKKIADSVLNLIGNTPLMALTNYSEICGLKTPLIAKLDCFNAGGSSKSRIALNMIKQAEEEGLIAPNTILIEPTSGNTGIGLAMVCAAKKYKLILTMPETMSIERRKLIKAYGADIVLTPGSEGMNGAINKAKELANHYEHAFIPQQFENKANPAIHKKTTAEEIWTQTDGNIDVFVAGVGTGGTITGIGEWLKAKDPNIEIVAVEPKTSAVLSGNPAGKHGIQGIGAGFIPAILNTDIIDRIVLVSDDDAKQSARNVGVQDGMLIGISSGAAVHAATELAKQAEYDNKCIVVFCPDSGERYLSTDLYDA